MRKDGGGGGVCFYCVGEKMVERGFNSLFIFRGVEGINLVFFLGSGVFRQFRGFVLGLVDFGWGFVYFCSFKVQVLVMIFL